MQFWEFVEGSGNDHDTKHSSRYQGDIVSMVSDTGGVTEPSSWFQPPNFSNTNAMETESFQEIFGGLTDIECHPILQATTSTELERELPWESCKVDSSGSKKKFEDIPRVQKSRNEGTDKLCGESRRKKHDQRPKRTRSVEMHNVSERRRRHRINGKLRALQELIPNCHKQDRASMLEDAVEYLKALKLQVEILSLSGGTMCQASCMPQAGVPSVPIPQFSIDAPLRPSSGMGMFSMFHSLGLPMISLPSAVYLHSSLSAAAAAGLKPMTAHGNLPTSQVQIPFISSQTLPADVAAPSTVPTLATGSLLRTIVLPKDSLVLKCTEGTPSEYHLPENMQGG